MPTPHPTKQALALTHLADKAKAKKLNPLGDG